MEISETEVAQIDDRALDPFGFFPNFISRVEGLGGTEPGFDPFFVFHTPYIRASSGRWRFTMRFSNLRARFGTLVLRIHVLPDAPGAVARLVNSERLPLTRLTEGDASVTIDFVGMSNTAYALMGQIPDRTDAAADDLLVSVGRLDSNAVEDERAETENTPFRIDTVVANTIIVSPKEPSLSDPVSQPFTTRQVAEPIFQTWSSRLGHGNDGDATAWCDVFALQTLDRYGALRPGARGLAVDNASEAFTRVVSESEIALVHVPLLEVSTCRDMPLVDFFYGIDRDGEIGRDRMPSLILSSLLLVRPGGLVIHIFPYTHDNPDRRKDVTAALDRSDIEKIALKVIGRGHDLAQLRPSLLDASHFRPNTMFGIIARRALVAA